MMEAANPVPNPLPVATADLPQVAQWITDSSSVGRKHLALTQLTDALQKRGPAAVFSRLVRQGDDLLAGAIATRIAGDAAMLVACHAAAAAPEQLHNVLDALHADLASAGMRFIQATWDADGSQPPFATAGFQPIAQLEYLSASVVPAADGAEALDEPWEVLAIDPREPAQLQRWIALVTETFEQTFDCPLLNQYRTPRDIVTAYLESPAFDPTGWRILQRDQVDVGCLITTPYPKAMTLELTYMGVIPAARGAGLGRRLIALAMRLARERSLNEVMLAVDGDNRPAIEVYREAGFVGVAREAVWGRTTVPSEKPPQPLTESPLLELDGVTVTRGEIRILDKIDLALPAGRHTAILGPNGSGKTSLLKLLIRQFYPSVDGQHAGTVRILGRSDWHIDELRKRLGIVSNELDHAFASGRSGQMTALEAVLSGFTGVRLKRHMKYDGDAAIEQATAALRRVGAESLAGRTLETMSTGERRRTLIARALVHQPVALVLDEPTTGLDIAARVALLRQLDELAADGTTLLLVTHHIEEILPAIEHVVFLDHGRILREGDRRSMLTAEGLSELFGTPLAIEQHGRSLSARSL